MSDHGLPILPHLASELYAWLWWSSEVREGRFDLGEPMGWVELWVDERLAFRNPEETKLAAVLTGENPSDTLEARAALAGGKVLQELRLGLRRDDRDFRVTLKGAAVDLHRVSLPQVVGGDAEEALLDRMFLYEELDAILGGLVRVFVTERSGPDWDEVLLPELRAWVAGVL